MTGLVQWHWLESRDVQERGEIAAAIGRLCKMRRSEGDPPIGEHHGKYSLR